MPVGLRHWLARLEDLHSPIAHLVMLPATPQAQPTHRPPRHAASYPPSPPSPGADAEDGHPLLAHERAAPGTSHRAVEPHAAGLSRKMSSGPGLLQHIARERARRLRRWTQPHAAGLSSKLPGPSFCSTPRGRGHLPCRQLTAPAAGTSLPAGGNSGCRTRLVAGWKASCFAGRQRCFRLEQVASWQLRTVHCALRTVRSKCVVARAQAQAGAGRGRQGQDPGRVRVAL